MVSLFTNLKKQKMYNLTEEEKQKIHTALICASDSGTLDEFTKEELNLINEAESIVNKLTIPVVSVPKGTLSDFEKWLDKKENESYCGLPSQHVLNKYKSLNAL